MTQFPAIHPIFLAVLLLLGFTAFPAHQELEEGLIAHYTFNHCDARDDTGNGSDGALYGEPGCACGVEDDAIWLDGVDDFIEFPGRVNRCFNTTDFTVSFYFKPAKYSVFQQSLLAKRAECDTYNMLDLQLDLTRREVNTAVYESPEVYFKDISPELPATDWMHYALVRRGTHAYTYINGQPRREGRRCSGVDIDNEAVLSFANSPCTSSGRSVRFKGALDELRVYDRALSDTEILALYNLYPVELAEKDCVSQIIDLPGERGAFALCLGADGSKLAGLF
ncbi:MAG: LamG domain-containing protein [Lewinellaceae bacterium]|nr:LamG domain-containing protein [Saprospiraceae bacterium]MCB9337408.1 LamG domain-containing protein [Lewinellaceae bacterium]